MDEPDSSAITPPSEATGAVGDPAGSPQISAIEGLEHWLETHIRNSVYAQSVETWNRIFSHVSDIKAALAAIDGTEK